jgi:hypothetical protein
MIHLNVAHNLAAMWINTCDDTKSPYERDAVISYYR